MIFLKKLTIDTDEFALLQLSNLVSQQGAVEQCLEEEPRLRLIRVSSVFTTLNIIVDMMSVRPTYQHLKGSANLLMLVDLAFYGQFVTGCVTSAHSIVF